MSLSEQNVPTPRQPGRFRDIQRFLVFLLAYVLSQFLTLSLLKVFVAPVFTGSYELAALLATMATAGAGFLAAWLTRSWGPPLAWGRLTRRNVSSGIALITLLDLAALVATYLLDVPEEPMMIAVFNGGTWHQNTCMLIAYVIVAPISGTLAINQLLFNARPWERSRGVAILAAVATATAYLYVTMPYAYWGSYVTSFASLMITFGARYVSRGLLLPMLLAAYSTALVIVLATLYYG